MKVRGEEKRRGEPSVNHSTRVRNVVTDLKHHDTGTGILLPVFAFVAVMVLLSSWTSTKGPGIVRTTWSCEPAFYRVAYDCTPYRVSSVDWRTIVHPIECCMQLRLASQHHRTWRTIVCPKRFEASQHSKTYCPTTYITFSDISLCTTAQIIVLRVRILLPYLAYDCAPCRVFSSHICWNHM